MSELSHHASLPGDVYEAMYAQGIDGFLLTSPDGRIHRANARACELLGWSEAEIVELSRSDLADRRDPTWVEAVAVRGRDSAYRGVLACAGATGRPSRPRSPPRSSPTAAAPAPTWSSGT